MQTIVLGIDESPGARAAVEWCAVLAKTTAAEVIVVHASTTPPVWDPAGSFRSGINYRSDKAHLETDWVAPLRSAGVPVRTVMTFDEPAALIRRTADQIGAELIILGSHAHKRWAPPLLGTVAHEVLREANCPVAIVPQPHGPNRGRSDGSAVVGVDGSDSSIAALRFGLRYADEAGLKLHVVSVLGPGTSSPEPIYVVCSDEGSSVFGGFTSIDALIADEGSDTKAQVTHATILGDPAEELIKLSTEAELLIVGDAQQGPLEELFHGSTGHHFAARADCPVILVPALDVVEKYR